MPKPGPHKGMPAGPKPKNTKGTAIRLLKYVGKQKALFAGMIIFALVSSIATVSASLFMKPIIDDILTPMIGKPFTSEYTVPLFKMLALMGGVFLLGAAASFWQSRCSVFLTQRTLNTIRKELFDAVSDLPVSYFDSRPNGEIMSRFTNDVDTIGEMLNSTIISLFSGVITIVGTFSLMIYTNWMLPGRRRSRECLLLFQ